jgi:uncharacterized integral membrane protein (TIGR00697 family)
MTATEAPPAAARPLKDFKFLYTLLTLFVAILLISNIVGSKVCRIWGITIGGANLLFPLTYIFGDVFTEVYGYAASRRAIWLGFICSGLLAVMSMIMVALPPDPEWKHQEAYATILGASTRIIIASLIAYWCGEFANSFAMAKIKVLTRGKHLWMRTISSTVVGQGVDTAVFLTLAFWGEFSGAKLGELILNSYIFKVVYEVVATPLTYAVVNGLKRAEGVDVFDYQTNFSPFKNALGG